MPFYALSSSMCDENLNFFEVEKWILFLYCTLYGSSFFYIATAIVITNGSLTIVQMIGNMCCIMYPMVSVYDTRWYIPWLMVCSMLLFFCEHSCFVQKWMFSCLLVSCNVMITILIVVVLNNQWILLCLSLFIFKLQMILSLLIVWL